MRTQEQQKAVDEEHVRLLGIFYYVSGGLSALFGLFPLIYVAMGAVIMAIPNLDTPPEGELAVRSMGAMFAGMGLVFFIVAQAFAAIKILAGYWLLRKRNRMFCLVVAGIICIGIPYSTVLGVLTFVVLLRDSVRELFAASSNESTPQNAT